MPEPFKNLLDATAVRGLADGVAAVAPDFPAARFVDEVVPRLPPLELKDRVRAVAAALRHHLPEDWPTAAATLVAALPPALPDDTEVSHGFRWWPVLQVVEDFGAHDPATSLPALREMTRRFSAEFAVRPLIDAWPIEAAAALDAWVTDPCPHVRRLVSEGSRPRLPWGRRLAAAIADPAPNLARLARLVDDPSAYVRRSVANHLGDVAKDHPELAVATAAAWLDGRPDRLPLVRHGLRSLLKAGHPRALGLLGHPPAEVTVTDAHATPSVQVGEPFVVTATLRAPEAATVRVDVVWRWPGARGGWSSRTFRGTDVRLAPGEPRAVTVRVATKPVSTRPTRPGPQQLVLRVNGVDQPPIGVELRPADADVRGA